MAEVGACARATPCHSGSGSDTLRSEEGRAARSARRQSVPISYEIDAEARMIFTSVTGEVSVEEMLAHLRALAKDPRYQPDFRGLSDYTGAAPFKATGEDVWRLAEALPVAAGARRA